jgi:hypothetical protein
MLYETCEEVHEEFWQELAALLPAEVTRRTGAVWQKGVYRLPFLNRELEVDPAARQVRLMGENIRSPDFRLCLTVLLYLNRVHLEELGPPISPLELPGGSTFFMERGPHALPHAPLVERFGEDPDSFLAAGLALGGVIRAAGDVALAFEVFPGLTVEVILWAQDEEFPAQVSFTVSRGLERFWHLDAVLGVLQLLVREILAVAG